MMTIAWKATAILVAAFCAAACLRHRSASLRHFIWTATFAALLIVPAFSLVTPAWQPVATIAELPVAVTAVAAAGPPAFALPWLTILYAAGAFAAAARFLAGALRTSWIVRHASWSDLGAALGVRVVTSPHIPMPLAWGILRRVIVLPAASLDWPAARLRAVLLHESMHHRRRDLLTQAVAQVACCLFWCHPLVWLALVRQRRERERACDDAVLRHGIAAHDYATHLIDVVRGVVAAGRRNWSDAPAMADASSLETRVRAVLDRGIDRRPLSRSAAVLVAAGMLLVLTTASVVDLRALATGGTITGVVEDPSGARVPGCKVTAKNLDGSNEEVAVANAAGEYRFLNIPPGHYVLEFGSRGFALRKIDADLVPNMVVRVDARLAVGQTTESVQVSGKRSSPIVTPQNGRAPERIRVGGNITPLKLLRQTRPVYPPDLQQLGVEGTVVMRAVVSKDGAVLNPKVLNSADSRLAKAALDAVSQWQYQPALLNGEPIETLTTISVDFHLEP